MPPIEAADPSLHWRIFFSSAADRDRAADALGTAQHGLEITCEEVTDDDWAARSQREISAVSAGPFIVAPPWDGLAGAGRLDAGDHRTLAWVRDGPSCLDAVVPAGAGEHRRARRSGARPGHGLGRARDGGIVARRSRSDRDRYRSRRDRSGAAGAALNPGVENVEWVVGDFRDQSSPRWLVRGMWCWPISPAACCAHREIGYAR